MKAFCWLPLVAALFLGGCYNPDGTVNPAATALAGAGVGAAAGLAIGAATAPRHYYYAPARGYYGHGHYPRRYYW